MSEGNRSPHELSVGLNGAPEAFKKAVREITAAIKTPGSELAQYHTQFLEILRTVKAIQIGGEKFCGDAIKYRLALKQIADPNRSWQIDEAREYAKAIID